MNTKQDYQIDEKYVQRFNLRPLSNLWFYDEWTVESPMDDDEYAEIYAMLSSDSGAYPIINPMSSIRSRDAVSKLLYRGVLLIDEQKTADDVKHHLYCSLNIDKISNIIRDSFVQKSE